MSEGVAFMNGSGLHQMDGHEHTLSGPGGMEWLDQLEAILRDASGRPGAPVLDIEWLLGRCADTRAMDGEWQAASLSQLKKDADAFRAEFPGILDDE